MEHKKKVKLRLQGLDGNAFAIMGAFRRQAKKENWSPEEIDYVLTKAQSGDYDHLIRTMIEHSDEPTDCAIDELGEDSDCDRDSDE